MYKYGTSLTPRAYGKNELVLLVLGLVNSTVSVRLLR